jgi:hypothetical protein
MKPIRIYMLLLSATLAVYVGCQPIYHYDPICPTGSPRNKWSESVDGVVFQGESAREVDIGEFVRLNVTMTNNSDKDAVIVGATLDGEQVSLQGHPAQYADDTIPAHSSSQSTFVWDLPKGHRGSISDYLGKRLSITWRLAIGEERHAIHLEMLSYHSQTSHKYGWLWIVGSVGLALVLVILILKVYFYPNAVAKRRHHPSRELVFILNLFTGWTGIGWIAALEMAKNRQERNTDDFAAQCTWWW